MTARLALARWHQRLGWAGWLGAVFIGVAGGLVCASRSTLPTTRSPDVAATLTAQPDALHQRVVVRPMLPSLVDIPVTLARIEYSALDQALGWTAADYRIVPGSETELQRLEIRCSLKGSYPKVRAMLSDLLQSVPGLTLQDLSIARATSASETIEAKLVLAVLFRDQPAAATAAASGVRR